MIVNLCSTVGCAFRSVLYLLRVLGQAHFRAHFRALYVLG